MAKHTSYPRKMPMTLRFPFSWTKSLFSMYYTTHHSSASRTTLEEIRIRGVQEGTHLLELGLRLRHGCGIEVENRDLIGLMRMRE